MSLWKAIALLSLAGGVMQAGQLDLFLLIGQSNMAGRGVIEEEDRAVIPKIYVLDKDLRWKPAVDPLHFDKPEIAGVGLGRSFAKTLAALRPSAEIGLIPAAFGGSSLREWEKGSTHYENAVRRAREAMKSGTLRGILWHQGEADATTGALARTYGERWSVFIRELRADLGTPDVPVLLGELGRFLGPSAPIVNQQLALIPLSVPHTAFVSSAELTPKADNVHFDTRSLREFGRRYACVFLTLAPSWCKLN